MRGHVLIDNFTLQGAYNYLWQDDRRRVSSECLATFIDTMVLYDKVFVPSLGQESHYGIEGNGLFGEREDRDMWHEILDKFSDVVPVEFVDSDLPISRNEFLNQTYQLTISKAKAQYGWNPQGYVYSFRDDVTESFLPSYDPNELSTGIEDRDGFRPFEEYRVHLAELARIDPLLGRDYPRLIPTTKHNRPSEDQLFKLFVGFHLYYTDYCVELARTRQLNYLPNPTRVKLIDNSSFFQQRILLENVRRDIVSRFQRVHTQMLEKLTETLSMRSISIDAPLLFNYVTRSSSKREDIVSLIKELRSSKEAEAFRKYCREIEKAIEDRQVKTLSRKVDEVNRIAEKWETNLRTGKGKMRINIKIFNVELTGLELPDLDFYIYSKQLARHYIFLHKLVMTL